MASLTPTQYQNLILAQVGDPDGTLATELPTLWTLSGAAGRSANIQFLYTKREALQMRIDAWAAKVTKKVGPLAINYSDRPKALQTQFDRVEAEIVRQEKVVRSSGGIAVGALVTTSADPNPSVNPYSVPAEAASLRGSPYGDTPNADGTPRR